VKNRNDNAPTFVPDSPVVHVSEAVAIGTKVVKFNATDEDGTKLSFSISEGNTNDDFAVDKDTGLLTTKKKLDREKIPLYNLTVTVTESTNTRATGQSSSQNLSVIVTDENDNRPVFDPKKYTEDIDENTPAGRLIYRLKGRLT
jgi:Zn-dependent M28 family amino/carboxypeptidase